MFPSPGLSKGLLPGGCCGPLWAVAQVRFCPGQKGCDCHRSRTGFQSSSGDSFGTDSTGAAPLAWPPCSRPRSGITDFILSLADLDTLCSLLGPH